MGSRLDKSSNAVRKRIESHTFSDETGEEYEPSAFGGFSDYFRRKKIKLQNLDSELRAGAKHKPHIFKGIVAHVSGYTQPPLDVLHRDLVEHGAGFLQYLDSKTMATHIVASHLPPKKALEFSKYRVVKPAWVQDSIRAGRVLPWSDYRVLEETPRQKTLRLDGASISSQSKTQSSPLPRYREQTENSYWASQLRDFAASIDAGHAGDRAYDPSAPAAADKGGLVNDRDPPWSMRSTENTAQVSTLSDNPKGSVSPEGGLMDTDMVEEAGSTRPSLPVGQNAPPIMDDTGSNMAAKARDDMTPEEHNALLLQDPRMKKSSTANPDFISQYYSESRLHHLSTWKAELKSRMQKLAAEKGPVPKLQKRRPGARRYIMHVDFDSFFCAVSLKSAPEYTDKPAVVAHGPGTGSEIASCNYPARKYGVKNGMWMKWAKELCPELKVLPYDFPAYEEASRLFYECILHVGGVVQSVSIDEALVDTTAVVLSAVGSEGSGVDEGSIWREQEKADQIAWSLRQQIKDKTACVVSVGIGNNILLAKVALRKAKPAGQYQMKPEEVHKLLGDLKVDDLPGVAYSTAGKLEEIGVKYVDDVRQTSKEKLVTALGPKTGERLWEYARGIDRTEVGDQPLRKSVSAEVNWGIRFTSQEEAEEFIFNLCKELERRLLNEHVRGKQLTMKIMKRSFDAPRDPPKHLGHGKCDTFNKSIVFGVATHDAQSLGKEAVSILRSYQFSPGELRGLGVQLTKLEPNKSSLLGPESSQKKLNFGLLQGPGSAKKASRDPIPEADSPDLPGLSPVRGESRDPIRDGPLTPRKPKPDAVHPALAISRVCEKDAKANTPLNVAGTQFILPTNADPTVMAELPPDIRSRLLSQGKPRSEAKEEAPETRSGSRDPSADEIPPDIDPEVFHALPEDMKAEVLASYKPRSGRSLLLQSPRKDRITQPAKRTTPTKRRVPGLFARAWGRQTDAQAKVVQTNLFCVQQAGQDDPNDVEELDAAFLAELPEDVRKEVVADHRRKRAQRSGIDLKVRPRNHHDGEAEEVGVLAGGQTRLQFDPPPAKVPFTAGGLTTVPEVRDMLHEWHSETRAEGPHRRDVEMFGKYLARVVLEERDMDKAAKLVRWLGYLVREDDQATQGDDAWRAALDDIQGAVQEAVRGRGLGPVDLG